MLKFKINIINALKQHGYNTARIRHESLIGQKTLGDMKKGIVPGIKTINKLCELLEMQPGEFLEYENENKKSFPQ